ncbi:MAG: haloacid dehalogenase-like hydrolase [Candidatus Eremiobacteraeota bacterium]|nr:haloacid dehalogenase-like hydrolase [Candidatus Eremiobacteraeota bacterium]
MHGPKLLVFDVCGTLFSEDTTIGLLERCLALHAPRRHLLFRLLSNRYSPFNLLLRVLEKASSHHIYKHLAIRLLAGISEEQMAGAAQSYLEYLLEHRVHQPVFDEFLEARQSGRTILVSASLDPIIRALADFYKIEYLASQLESHAGRFTGRLLLDLTGRKLEALTDYLGSPTALAESHCYTDNFSDLEFARQFKHRTIILLSPRHRNRWGSLKARYLGERP